MEILLFGLGFISGGLLLWKLKPHYLEKLYAQRHREWAAASNKIKELEQQINILTNPKRLINEYKGGTGSSTGTLLKTMRQEIKGLADEKADKEAEVKDISTVKRKLQSEITILKQELSKKLQDKFDKAIDEISKLLERARNGDTSVIKSTIHEIDKLSKSLDSGKLWD